MRERVQVIWGDHKTDYFFGADWTGVIGLNEQAKLVFRRTRISGTKMRAKACQAGGIELIAWPVAYSAFLGFG
jgi:hypothetical protein